MTGYAHRSHVIGASLVAQAGKESTCNTGDLCSIPGLGRFPRRKATQSSSGLENSVDYIVHGVTKSQTGLNDFHFTWNRIIQNNL